MATQPVYCHSSNDLYNILAIMFSVNGESTNLPRYNLFCAPARSHFIVYYVIDKNI